MKRKLRTLLLAVAGLAGANAFAGQTMYITDQVLADLYADQFRQEEIGTLPTGTRVEVLRKANGYARVRLDGGLEGWVQASWLSEQEPAQSVLLRLADQYDRAKAQLKELKGNDAKKTEPTELALPEIPEEWLYATIGGSALLFGFLMGIGWMDRRYRKRHGGFRI